MYQFASASDKVLMYIGWTCAAITGTGMPSFVFLIGDVIDSFKPTNTVESTLRTISKMSLIFTLVGVAIWITSLIMYSLLLLFSERVVKKTRTKYLEAILRQDSSWFDTVNPSELSARLSKECQSMQKALGEKMGTIILAFAMTVAGLAFAFTKGWSFSLVLLAVFPFLGFTTSLMAKVMAQGSQETMKAYGQSAGYADQALNAIRVVVAYGQEEKEVKNYSKYLHRARTAGIRTHFKGSMAMAMFFASIFGTYAYSFYLGSVWIYKGFQNQTYNRTYSAGDILSCFFGVIFGMFSVGLAAPNIKAVTEGRVAAKLAFDIIDRKPAIDQDAPGKTTKELKGDIEFKNVSFYYPSRPE
jgi:ATP-binding cassette subfamily B (MDR/TAP) protein 1